ncbi:hypothetical protein BGW38_004861 [Lunasporangiospora selenospora]|uniref:WRKY domain-containing protein n=1 Tax=Lunasporangiospora selenospora TaxID=979761 RepID=A0A9P6FNQ5_9FUNG|nr:hypothetical protein BGW38_004861 [Lunasporangiospora selenospora]
MLANYGGVLPSPPSSQLSSTPTADLESILTAYGSQPDLLKMIIASKTEEDRRWAEEARLRMLDLCMRGDGPQRPYLTGWPLPLQDWQGRQRMAGQQRMGTTTTTSSSSSSSLALGSGTGLSSGTGAPASDSGTGADIGSTCPGTATSTGTVGANSAAPALDAAIPTTPIPTTTSSSSSTILTTNTTAGSPLSVTGHGAGLGAGSGIGLTVSIDGMSSVMAPTVTVPSMFPGGHYGAISDAVVPVAANGCSLGGPSTPTASSSSSLSPPPVGALPVTKTPVKTVARKRSVTFAREVHHGHVRSQSLSSVPTLPPPTGAVGPIGGVPTMGLNGSPGQQHMLLQHQQQPHLGPSAMAPHLGPSPLGYQQQQQSFPYQQQPRMPFQQYPIHTQPPFHQFSPQQPSAMPPTPPQSLMPHPQQQGLPPPFGQYPAAPLGYNGVTNTTSALPPTMHHHPHQHHDEDSDDDYSDHTGMGHLSRPGSAMSMTNGVGGLGETMLTLEFSGMTTLSEPTGLGSPLGFNSSSTGCDSSLNSPDGMNVNPSILSSMGPSSIPGALGSGLGFGRGPTVPGQQQQQRQQQQQQQQQQQDLRRKRKRREMQPVNRIVETIDVLQDYFLWKNNGNTTQKKTKCKSIYYKCSNSNSGCTVNKTVTEKEGGGYLTKYRGEHLEECHRKRTEHMLQLKIDGDAPGGSIPITASLANSGPMSLASMVPIPGPLPTQLQGLSYTLHNEP